MSNLHTPERQPDESQAKYRERQAASRAAVKQMLCGGEQRMPARMATDAKGAVTQQSDPRGYWHGQHTNEAGNARRSVKAAIGARQYRKQRKALAAAARG